MKIFDPHIHMTSRTTDDYEKMAKAGIQAIVEPAFWLGQPRTSVGSFEDYFLSLVGWERFRAKQFGIHHFCTMALNPKEANNKRIASQVLEILPKYLSKESVLAVGEIGLDDQTEQEESVFVAQLEMAKEFNLPVLVHTPHRDKKAGTKRCMDIVLDFGFDPGKVLIDHNTEETVKNTLDKGFWAGHSIYPHTKMDARRMAEIVKNYGTERIIVNSAADWGVSDPLMTVHSIDDMKSKGFEQAVLDKVFWQNPIEFFAQSGRINAAMVDQPPVFDQTMLHEGNSVLRGQEPKKSGMDA